MNMTAIPRDYGLQVSRTVQRLTRDIHDAATEGDWAVSEVSRLHAWMLAEVVPWARSVANELDPPQRARVNQFLVDLADLDAIMLGTAGTAAADVADQVKQTIDRLVVRVGFGLTSTESLVPEQRDNVP